MLKMIAPMAVVICSLSVAFAEDLDERVQDLFNKLDVNRDGILTRGELDGNEEKLKLFDQLLPAFDKDKDGSLSNAEFLKVFEPPQEESSPAHENPPPDTSQGPPQQGGGLDAGIVFSRLDNNQDGRLEPDELPDFLREKLAPAFKSLGKDALTKEDFVPAFRTLFARPSFPSPKAFFELFDKNQDGKVTIGEVPENVRPSLQQMLDQLNAEFITKDDYTKIYELLVERSQPSANESNVRSTPGEGFVPDDDFPPPGPVFFRLLDTDRDGKLSSSELSQASQVAARLDRDGDNLLDLAEFSGFGRGRPDGRFGPGRRRPDLGERTADRPERPPINEEPKVTAETVKPEPPHSQTAPANLRTASHARFADELFVKFDKNQDGKLSSEEAPARLRRNFSLLDLDGDEKVSKEELTQALVSRNR